MAHAEAVRLGRLVDDLHTLALADAHELPIQAQPVEPRTILRHVAHLFEAEARAGEVDLVVRRNGPVPAIRADPDRLVQALGNLAGNALRHTPAGGTITLRAWTDGSGGVVLAVADTGEGIPPDVLPIVFERSVRADTARGGDGSGLGLSIVRSLVEAMGGRVAAASEPGAGTTVTIRLPTWNGQGDAGESGQDLNKV
jgi:two-component system sensor histidine kinase BaeS